MTGAPSPLFGTSYFRERPREVQGEGALTPTIIEEGGQFLWLLFFFFASSHGSVDCYARTDRRFWHSGRHRGQRLRFRLLRDSWWSTGSGNNRPASLSQLSSILLVLYEATQPITTKKEKDPLRLKESR